MPFPGMRVVEAQERLFRSVSVWVMMGDGVGWVLRPIAEQGGRHCHQRHWHVGGIAAILTLIQKHLDRVSLTQGPEGAFPTHAPAVALQDPECWPVPLHQLGLSHVDNVIALSARRHRRRAGALNGQRLELACLPQQRE